MPWRQGSSRGFFEDKFSDDQSPKSRMEMAGFEMAEPMVDTDSSVGKQSEPGGEIKLLRALGEIILRAQETQVERLLKQGKQLEETLIKQQWSLSLLEKHVAQIAGVNDDSKKTQRRIPNMSSVPEHDTLDQTNELDQNSPMGKDFSEVLVNGCETPVFAAAEETNHAGASSMISRLRSVKAQAPARLHVPKRCGASFVASTGFGLSVGLMIFLNAVFILLQTDESARNPSLEIPQFYMIGETVFFLMFATELALRIWVFRLDFFTGDEWRWNCFDFLIVAAAACEELTKYIEQGHILVQKATFLRAMRILKIGRMTRVFRVVTLFRDLRIMMASIISTMVTLFWSIVCLVMIMVSFATYFLTVASDHQANNGIDPELEPYFGSIAATMLSLFQMTTGGFDWRDMSNQLMAFSPVSVAVLCVYISMMHYAIMNILTGICCNTANKAAEEDFDITLLEESSRQESVLKKLKQYLYDNDESGEGLITWEQLARHLANNQEVRGYFKRLELERWHLQNFFVLLDVKDDVQPSIRIDNFIRCCMRLRCQVKNIDLIAANQEQSYGNKRSFSELKQKIEGLQSSLTCATTSV